jgi:hypothetical protein
MNDDDDYYLIVDIPMEYEIQNEFVVFAMYQFLNVVQCTIVQEPMEHFLIVQLHVCLIANCQLLNEHEYGVVDGWVAIDDWMLIQRHSNYRDDFDHEPEMVC